MTDRTLRLPLASLSLLAALLSGCAGTGSAAPGPQHDPAAAGATGAETALSGASPATPATDLPAAAPEAAHQPAVADHVMADPKAAEQTAAEARAAVERAAAEERMRREKEIAEAAAAAEQARIEAAARAAQQELSVPAVLPPAPGSTPQAAAGAPPAVAEKTAAQAATSATTGAVAPAVQGSKPAAASGPAAPEEDYSQLVADIQTSKGSLVLQFFPDVAPAHVKAFVTLSRKGFYEGLKFHRIVPGFIVQGGCPKGDGTGDPGYHLKAEWNDRLHKRGTLSMARGSHPDSAGSQFFICHREDAGHDLTRLDGRYTVFGQLVRGFEVLDAIAAAGSPNGTPTETVTMLKVTIRPLQDGDRDALAGNSP